VPSDLPLAACPRPRVRTGPGWDIHAYETLPLGGGLVGSTDRRLAL
jgi:hypothetical protein